MRTYLPVILIIFILSFSSCEEVIDIPLQQSEPRLVIDASIIWYKGTAGNEQHIRISRTAGFYAEDIEGVTNATVRIISADRSFNFIHQSGGDYVNMDFQPALDEEYKLELELDGEHYTATETLIPVVDIDYIEQLNNGGFSGNDIELKAYYTDPSETEDYYLFKFENNDVRLEFYEDEFTNGNQIFGYYSTEDLETGDEVGIQIQGISKSYYEYLFILRSQVGSDGGPFETMPATVKGNIINRTTPGNYPFGYFRLSEADSTTYIIE